MKVDSSKEYYSNLFEIQTQNAPTLAVLLPKSEKIYSIDLNQRTIEAPSEFSIVASDHASETIYFKMPRYYDNMDMAQTVCIVQYTNADKKSFIYPVPYYDVDTLSVVDIDEGIDEPMMIIPWQIAGTAAAKAGKVTFAFQFYLFDGRSDIIYNLNTLTQTLTIKTGLTFSKEDIQYTEESLVQQTYEKYFATAAQKANEGGIYWETYPFSS